MLPSVRISPAALNAADDRRQQDMLDEMRRKSAARVNGLTERNANLDRANREFRGETPLPGWPRRRQAGESDAGVPGHTRTYENPDDVPLLDNPPGLGMDLTDAIGGPDVTRGSPTPEAEEMERYRYLQLKAKATAGAKAKTGGSDAPQSSMLDQVGAEFPTIGKAAKGYAYRQSPATDGRMLEFYPQGERDSFDPSKPAIEVFGDRAKPLDVAGDIVSHHLAKGGDPHVTKTYQDFEKSLSPEQQGRLREQYAYAQKNEGERRPFEQWYQQTGLPAYFRGYPFKQWQGVDHFYTPEQRASLDDMMGYLRTGQQQFKRILPEPDRNAGMPDIVGMSKDYEAQGGRAGGLTREGMGKLRGPGATDYSGVLDLAAGGARAAVDYYTDPKTLVDDKIAGTMRAGGELSGISPMARVIGNATSAEVTPTMKRIGWDRPEGYQPGPDIAATALNAMFSGGRGQVAETAGLRPIAREATNAGLDALTNLTGGTSDLAALAGKTVIGSGREAARGVNGLLPPPRTAAARPVPTPSGAPQLPAVVTPQSTVLPNLTPRSASMTPQIAARGPAELAFDALHPKVRDALGRALDAANMPKPVQQQLIRTLNALPADRVSQYATEMIVNANRMWPNQFPDLEGLLMAIEREHGGRAPTGKGDIARSITNEGAREAISAEPAYLAKVAKDNFGPGAVMSQKEIDGRLAALRKEYHGFLNTKNPYGTERSVANKTRIDQGRANLAGYLKRVDTQGEIPDWLKQDTINTLNRDLREMGEPTIERGATGGFMWAELVDKYPTQLAHALQSTYATAAREAKAAMIGDVRAGALARNLSELRGRSTSGRGQAKAGYGLLDLLEKATPKYKGKTYRETRIDFGTEKGAETALNLPKRILSVGSDEVAAQDLLDDLGDLTPAQFETAKNQITTAVRNQLSKKPENPTLSEVGAGEKGKFAPNTTLLAGNGFLKVLEEGFGQEGKTLADAIRRSRANTNFHYAALPSVGSKSGLNLEDAKNAANIYEHPLAKDQNVIDASTSALTAGGGIAAALNPAIGGPIIAAGVAKGLYNLWKRTLRLSPKERSQFADFLFAARRPEEARAVANGGPLPNPQLPGPPNPPRLPSGPAASNGLLTQAMPPSGPTAPSTNGLVNLKPPAPIGKGKGSGPVKMGFGGGDSRLPMDRAAQTKRAHDQGFETEAYRGDVAPPGSKNNGDTQWFSGDPGTARSYLNESKGPWGDTRFPEGANIAPTRLRLGKNLVVNANGANWNEIARDAIAKADPALAESLPSNYSASTPSIAESAKAAGYDSVTFKGVRDHLEPDRFTGMSPTSTVHAVFDTKNVRGRFAKFDPAKRDAPGYMNGPGESRNLTTDWAIPAASAVGGFAAQPEGTPIEQRLGAAGMSFFGTRMAAPAIRGGVNALKKVPRELKPPSPKTYDRAPEQMGPGGSKPPNQMGGGKGPTPPGQSTPEQDLARATKFGKRPLDREDASDWVALLKDETDPRRIMDVLGIEMAPSVLRLPRGRAMVERTRDAVLAKAMEFFPSGNLTSKRPLVRKMNDEGATDEAIARAIGVDPADMGDNLGKYLDTLDGRLEVTSQRKLLRGKRTPPTQMGGGGGKGPPKEPGTHPKDKWGRQAWNLPEHYMGPAETKLGYPRKKVDARISAGQFSEATVPISELTPTQRGATGAFRPDQTELPFVVREKGKLYLYDGHNRTVDAARRGETSIKAHVVDLDAPKTPPVQTPSTPSTPKPPGQNGLNLKAPKPKLPRAEQAVTDERRAARAAYTRAYNESFNHLKKVPQTEYVKSAFERKVVAEKNYDDFMAKKAKFKTMKGQAGDFLLGKNGLRDYAGAAAIGAGGIAAGGGLMALNGSDKKPPSKLPDPGAPTYFWDKAMADKSKVIAVQTALNAWRHWAPDTEMNGSYGPMTKDGLAAWRSEARKSETGPMTQEDAYELFAGPGGYKDKAGWHYPDGEKVKLFLAPLPKPKSEPPRRPLSRVPFPPRQPSRLEPVQ